MQLIRQKHADKANGASHAPGTPTEGTDISRYTNRVAANRYLKEIYMPACNAEFWQPEPWKKEQLSWPGLAGQLTTDILCEPLQLRYKLK